MPPGASLLYKAISTPLLLHAFPLFGSPLLACQPPSPSLPSTPANDTSTVLSPTSPRFPLRKTLSPRPASSQRPLGRGTIKTGQVLSRSVESRVSDGTLPVWLQMWLNWVLRVLLPSQNNNVQCLLYLRSTFAEVQGDGSTSKSRMLCSPVGAIYLVLLHSDIAQVHQRTHPQIHCYIPVSANYRPALTALDYSPQPRSTIHVNPSVQTLFLPSLLPSLPLPLLLWISVFRVWNIKQTYLATPSGTESELSPESGRRR